MASIRRLAAWIFTLILLSSAVRAQRDYSKVELGAQYSYIGNRVYDGSLSGLGPRATINLTSNLAIETEANFYLNQVAVQSLQEGGHAFTFVAGPKAGIRWRHFGLFGKARPGLIHYSEAYTLNGPGTHALTHFSLDIGGVLEMYPSRRTIVRIDAGTLLMRFGSDRVGDVFSLGKIGSIAAPFVFSAGVSRRIGELNQLSSTEAKPAPFELGGQFSYLAIGNSVLDALRDEPGFGPRLGWNVTKNIAFEGEFNWFPRDDHTTGWQDGGSIKEGLFGLKAGIHRDKYGAFAKVRPGFVRYSRSITDYTFEADPSGLPTYHPVTHIALDAGGVLELYPSRRTGIRLDMSYLSVFMRPTRVNTLNGEFTVPYETRSGLQLSTGFFWRF